MIPQAVDYQRLSERKRLYNDLSHDERAYLNLLEQQIQQQYLATKTVKFRGLDGVREMRLEGELQQKFYTPVPTANLGAAFGEEFRLVPKATATYRLIKHDKLHEQYEYALEKIDVEWW